MLNIHKEYIVDDNGNPTKVILPLADFRLIEEMLGLDLDEEAVSDLKIAKSDREKRQEDVYIDLDDL
jgi:PHD/YefM family antitoxin component YafN of YafNO toxin-antitoxin module